MSAYQLRRLRGAEGVIRIFAGYWDLNTESLELFLCPRSRQMFGIDRALPRTLARCDWQPRIHPEDLPLIADELEVAERENEIYSLRFRIVRPDGSVREILGVGRNAEEGIGRFVGLNFDLADPRATAVPVVPTGSPANENELGPRHGAPCRPTLSLGELRSRRSSERDALLRRAQATMRLRELRRRLFDADMLGEPAFDILVALYTMREPRGALSVPALNRLLGVPGSTIGRWLRFLAEGGLVATAGEELGNPEMLTATLTRKGMSALDAYFGSFELV